MSKVIGKLRPAASAAAKKRCSACTVPAAVVWSFSISKVRPAPSMALLSATKPWAECATDCTLIRLETAAILRLITRQPEVALSLIAATFAHLHRLVAQIEQLKAQTGAQRVAEFLLELTECDCGPCEVVLPYDKVLIAGRLGMKPESLSRAFAKLRDKGVTVKQNMALIEDVEALRDYALEDPAEAWTRS